MFRSDIDMTPKRLLRAALEARRRAYCPYSRFRVGAALLGASGTVWPGCNVENASYGLTICAERNAVHAAVARGERNFTMIAVAAGGGPPGRPCGACLQVLQEFMPRGIVLLGDATGRFETFRLRDLLPHPFDPALLRR
jgi:cytidine deaminase